MSKVTIQVPVNKSLKISAEKVAEEYGFSSLQEAIRLFMAQFATRKLTVGFSELTEVLTDTQEGALNRKLARTKKEIASGKGLTATSVEEMLSQLRS